MKFIADLHVHSKFSRATSKNLDFENLYIAARKKGITVVGTGDFTHPGWFSEIREKLIPAEQGLFRLKDEIAKECDLYVPETCDGPVRFMLVSEISNIYKKNERTRKNHNLVFMPDLDSAARFNTKLDAIGNIKSDGRPILGLDARNLLEILLETSDQGFLIPAHVWTPWFSLLGSKSGFDSVEECFEDLTPHIFAVETGLSSDPAMNWRVSGLDGLTLVSNSDAHSPSKLGREANIFNTDLSYNAIKNAMETGDPGEFSGTFEFFPEEGKYHLDGHRKCNTRLSPEESLKHKGICPECGRPLTLGVMNRINALADRREGEKPEKNHPFFSVIPLEELLSEIFKVGPKSKRVQNAYSVLISKLGTEFEILNEIPIEKIENKSPLLLGEAIKRMRENEIYISPGYDGEFGKIEIFSEKEREDLSSQKSLFIMPEINAPKDNKMDKSPEQKELFENEIIQDTAKQQKRITTSVNDLNENQKEAVQHRDSPLLIVAGPGTGKTLTLTHRIAYLIKERNIDPANILALTFTNKAAAEMADRLEILAGNSDHLPFVGTFHSFCYKLVRETDKSIPDLKTFSIIDDEIRKDLIAEAIQAAADEGFSVSVKQNVISEMIAGAKQEILEPDDDLTPVTSMYECDYDSFAGVYSKYQSLLLTKNSIDYDGLIQKTVRILESDVSLCCKYQELYRHIFVDEYQDLNHGQYRMIKALAPENSNICVIGDPDQSIYGFRGSDPRYFTNFIDDYPDSRVISLMRNYRSTETILEASYHVIREQTVNIAGDRIYSGLGGEKTITVLSCATEKSEAVAVGKQIEQMIGGMGHYSIDFGKTNGHENNLGFSDFAVLYRTKSQCELFGEMFSLAGIPFQTTDMKDMFSQVGFAELLSCLKLINETGTFADLKKIAFFFGKGIGEKSYEIFQNWYLKNDYSPCEALFRVRRFPVPDMSRSRQIRLDEFAGKIFKLKQRVEKMSVEMQLEYIVNSVDKIKNSIEKNTKTEDGFYYLKSLAAGTGNNVEIFFNNLALQTDADLYDYKAEKVTLMTMHSAKGLEFPVVFIAGCEDDYIPYRKSTDSKTDLEEEQRLFYVGMTRAKEKLVLTHVKKRRVFGKLTERKISPFIQNIEDDLLKHEKNVAKKKTEKKHVQLTLFDD